MSSIFQLTMPKGIDRPELVTCDLTASASGALIDPFLVISLFDMKAPFFPPHPHAGFSVATYIFPESDIGFWNQDTMGNRNAIPPGAFHLTVAGSGLMHEETVSRTGRSATGLQIWIDHAAHDREVQPSAHHLAAADIPTHAENGVVRRVLLGSSAGLASPIVAPVQARIIDVSLDKGATLIEPVAADQTTFAAIRSGQVMTESGPVDRGVAVFTKGEALRLTAVADSRLTIFGGIPLRHTGIPAGPFVASTEDQARAFRTRFRAGDMGRLTPFDQAELDRAFDTSPG